VSYNCESIDIQVYSVLFIGFHHTELIKKPVGMTLYA
jgi:hypothetical protein